MHLTRGARVGQYEIVALLGTGGMGEVYRADDRKLGRQVAIKVLNAPAAGSDDIRRLEHEARAASALNHPGIVTIHDTGDCDGHFYIVMELIEGTTLRHLLRRGALPLKRALQVASQLADALSKAHDVGIVHRDLKPENVMVTTEGHVKIVDFGLAKLTEPAVLGARSADATITEHSARGILIGTVGYMSPEQASGASADFRADHFAFGAILYELATGARAFQRTTSVETLSMIISGEPERPLAINPALPLPLVWVIERCLSKDPADRYASTRDLARDVQTLRDHAAQLEPQNRLPLTGARRRGALRAAGAIAAAAVLGASATAAYLALRSGPVGAVATSPMAVFKQLTFGLGYVEEARFAPDGQTVLYTAAWNDAPLRLFETRPSGPESRPLGPVSAGLAGVSSRGELALIQRCRLHWGECEGTLAVMPLGGGAPRQLLEDVVEATWSPDGSSLAAIHVLDGEYRVEFPIGNALYSSAARLTGLAFSPRGDRLAFIEYSVLSEEGGFLKIVDLQGRVTPVSGAWKTIRNVVWDPDGEQIWVAASENSRTCSLYAVSLSGTRRLLLHTPGSISLFDVHRDRRALLAHGLPRSHMVWFGDKESRDLAWLDWSTVADLSSDGRTVLFYEWGQAVGATPIVYVRNIDGSDAVRLGEGTALALSPDGRQALALREGTTPQLVLLPTGAGEGRALPAEGLTDFYWARWFPDGRRVLVVGSGVDGVPSSYIQDTDSGRLTRIAEQGMLASLVAPDGRRVLVSDPLAGHLVWPLDGGQPQAVDGIDRLDKPIQWSADGKFLYVRGSDDSALRIDRLDLTTGQRQPWKELAPRDQRGVIGIATGRGELAMSPDGKHFVFTYWTAQRNLFLVAGLQ
jgi:Tol biopolymer transport system component